MSYLDKISFYREYFSVEQEDIQNFFIKVKDLNNEYYNSKDYIDSTLKGTFDSINSGISYRLISVSDIKKNKIVLHLENIKKFYESE